MENNTEIPLSIIPLGGVGEIGLNMTIFQWQDDILVVDAGLMFPEEEMLGVDIVIPDITYLKEHKDKIKGIILTHGHEDHIGAIPYILKDITAPLYGTPLTLGLISQKLTEHKIDDCELISIKPHDICDIGVFKVEFIRVTHSIVDGVGLGITTPVGKIVHTGDFKVDQTPVDGEVLDFQKFGEYGNKGTLVLLSDSTNSERPGYTLSEKEITREFNNIFANAKGRIIVATFASNIHRIQQIVDVAARYDRKIFIDGRSMINNADMAMRLGYLNINPDTWLKLGRLDSLRDNEIVIITTGSQGEPMSSLFRLAMNEHKNIKIKKGDLVIISARVIPGNERAIGRLINHLFKRGAKVVYELVSDIHVSGHASQEEQKMMINLIKPRYFIPVHGEYRQLYCHAEIAEKLNIKRENIFILEDGEEVQFTADRGWRTGHVSAGRVFVDGKRVGDVGNIVLRDRQRIGKDGIIIVIIGIEKMNGQIMTGPEIISRGFIFEEEATDILDEMKRIVVELLNGLNLEEKSEWIVVKTRVNSLLKKYIQKNINRRPMIIPIIIEM
ncbi:MAG: ribonuclease J [Nitrospirota bacterium]